MEIVAGVAEIDLHFPFDDHGVAPGIVVILPLQCATRVGHFPNTAKVITSIEILTGVGPTDALFALSEEAFRDVCARGIALFGNRVAGPDKRLDTSRARRRSQIHSQLLVGFVAASLRSFKAQRICSSRYGRSLPE